MNEVSAGIKAHWDGLFIIGAPDIMVVNVTKDSIWARRAALPGMIGMIPPTLEDIFGTGALPKKVEIPQPKIAREVYPEDVYRDPLTKLPNPLIIDLEKMLKDKRDKEDVKFQDDQK
jgi:hypothetical protein